MWCKQDTCLKHDGGGGECSRYRFVVVMLLVLLLCLCSGQRVFAATTEKPIEIVSNAQLMDDIGFSVYDKEVPVSFIMSNGLTWQYFAYDRPDAYGYYEHWSVVTTNANRRFSGGEWVQIRYQGAGSYRGDLIDIRVTFNFADSSSETEGIDKEIRGNISQLRLGENFTNWRDRTRANFVTGFTYFYSRTTDVVYDFYYTGTNTKLPIDACYFSWGSLNIWEGVSVYNHDYVSYYKRNGAYPTVQHANPYAAISFDPDVGSSWWVEPNNWGISADWLINQKSNNFEDNYRDGDDFWKSVGTCYVRSSNQQFAFHLFGPNFWFAPTLAPVGATAPKPVKKIVDGSGLVEDVTRHSGDTIVYEIQQGVEIYGYLGTGYEKYSNFSFADTLPDGVSYQSARVLKRRNGETVDVTHNGSLSYQSSTRTVRFSFSSSFVSSGMNYVGETYVLEITVTLDGADASRVLTNRASTTICNTLQTTNDVTVHQYYYPQRTYVRHRKVDGTWEAYACVNSVIKELHDSYSYTWTRNAQTEPTNVYYDADPAAIVDVDVTEANDHYIDVERKKYSYMFDYNPPDGYAVIGIGNRQDDILNQWAGHVSGSVKSPTLTGYTFLGWNTARDGSGSWYASEAMLSNKKFYANWRRNKYQVRYNANGSQNPDHLTGELTQNTVTGAMSNSEYEYDKKGSLRNNAFARKGYEFVGWNTKADGTGAAYGESAYDISNKLYSNGYANVYNMTSVDGKVLDLYAQWRKKLGKEVLTVVSEETGNPISGVQLRLYKNVNGSWQEVPGVGLKTTDANGQVSVGDLHWFGYEWRSVSVPLGYQGMTNVSYTVDYDHLDLSHRRILYLKRVTIVLDSVVDRMIAGERAPSFIYRVQGTDAAGVSHSYLVCVAVNGNTKQGTNSLSGVYAGTYTVTQTPVSRYVPGTAVNISHGTPNGIHGSVDVLRYDRAELKFPYSLRQYEGFGSMDNQDNGFCK